MSKITTDDCKKFIVQFQKDNPNLERVRFGITEQDNLNNNNDCNYLADCLLEKTGKEYLKENQMKMMVYQFIFQDKVLIGMLNRLAELALRILNVLVDLTWRQQKLRLRILSLK